jgi:hypothetical protein
MRTAPRPGPAARITNRPSDTLIHAVIAEMQSIASNHPYAASLTNHLELGGKIYPFRFPDTEEIVQTRRKFPRVPTTLENILMLWRSTLAPDDYQDVVERLGRRNDPLGDQELMTSFRIILTFYRDQAATDGPHPHSP